ncbi:MAG TPA: HlyD family secretion protein, partial [Alphaproteobacteria bacterium]|nr:HlyD family secretion protein [Alphaproteobacteria bacterium]
MLRRALALLAATLPVAGCNDGDQPSFQGYVEADFTFIVPDEGGRLVELSVEEGDRIAEDDPLFLMDAVLFEARAEEARARLAEARARLADLQSQQQRPEEIDVLQAGKRRADAALALSAQELERQRELFDRGVASRARLDEAEAAYRRDKAALEEITQQIGTARLSAREAEIAAAEAAVGVAEAAFSQAKTRLARREVAAPGAGIVNEIYYRPGEWAGDGQPVLSILRPADLRVRF